MSRTAITSPKVDSKVRVILTGLRSGNLLQGGYDNGAAGASQGRSQKHAITPLQMQQRPAHQGDQSQDSGHS